MEGMRTFFGIKPKVTQTRATSKRSTVKIQPKYLAIPIALSTIGAIAIAVGSAILATAVAVTVALPVTLIVLGSVALLAGVGAGVFFHIATKFK